MIKNVTFTDKQGTTYTNAVFKVSNARRIYNRSDSGIISVNLDFNDVTANLIEDRDITANFYQEIRVVYAYWKDWDTYSSKGSFYWLTKWEETSQGINAGTEWLINHDELSKPQYTNLSLEEACDRYLVDVLLPQLQT